LEKKDEIRTLVKDYGFDKTTAGRIWDYGPLGCGPNLLIDATKGV